MSRGIAQITLWVFSMLASGADQVSLARIISCCFLALVSLLAASGFLLYGGRLFLMLRRQGRLQLCPSIASALCNSAGSVSLCVWCRFPIESRGRRKKLREVGFVTGICATCFTLRAMIVAWAAFDRTDADLDVLDHPLLNLVYYTACELVPSALVRLEAVMLVCVCGLMHEADHGYAAGALHTTEAAAQATGVNERALRLHHAAHAAAAAAKCLIMH